MPLERIRISPSRGAACADGHCEIVPEAECRLRPEFGLALRVYAAWQTMPGAPLPQRRSLDPAVLGAALLPHIVLFDVLEEVGGRDYRWRLFGTRHEREYGRDLTGVRLSDLQAENASAAQLADLLDSTVDRAAPRFFDMCYLNDNTTRRRATGVMLPLSDGTGRLAHILGATSWRPG